MDNTDTVRYIKVMAKLSRDLLRQSTLKAHAPDTYEDLTSLLVEIIEYDPPIKGGA
jgi:hypothetical protein